MKTQNLVSTAILIILSLCLASCGSFGEGMLASLASYGSYPSYGGFSCFSGSSSNLDYLLDPNYAIAQTLQQQAQFNQVSQSIMSASVAQVNAEEEKEYQNFRMYNKKRDGSDYSKAEWREMKAKALAYSSSSNSSSSSSPSSSSSQSSSQNRQSQQHSCPYCNNTGQIIIEQAVATFGNDNSRYCSTCRQNTLSGYSHSHHSCKCGRPKTSGRIPTYNRIPW